MRSGEIVVRNKLGLHARVAAQIVRTASGFESKITISRGSQTADAKGIMGLMILAATQGTRLTLQAEGVDEDLAYHAIWEKFELRFGEPE